MLYYLTQKLRGMKVEVKDKKCIREGKNFGMFEAVEQHLGCQVQSILKTKKLRN